MSTDRLGTYRLAAVYAGSVIIAPGRKSGRARYLRPGHGAGSRGRLRARRGVAARLRVEARPRVEARRGVAYGPAEAGGGSAPVGWGPALGLASVGAIPPA